MPQKYHIIYETTNLINCKKYRGKHVTTDMNDYYLGSGTVLTKAVQKYGALNFSREILFVAFDEDSLNWAEEHVFVNQEWLNLGRNKVYNLVPGGVAHIQAQYHKDTVKELHGVYHYCQVPEVKEKVKATMIERHGVECTFQSPEIYQKGVNTRVARYGVEYSMQSPILLQKSKDTNMAKLGVEYPGQSPEVNAKAVATNIEKYGFENPMQNPDIKAKAVATNIEKYGFENVFQSEEIKEKSTLTIIEKFGVDNVAKSPVVQAKKRKNNLAKYGYEHTTQVPEFKEKTRATVLEKHGENYMADWIAKAKVSNLEKYGYEHTSQVPEFKEKRRINLEINGNPCKGRKAMSNPVLQQNKMVDAPMVEEFLANGWVIGKNDAFSKIKRPDLTEEEQNQRKAQSTEKARLTKIAKYGEDFRKIIAAKAKITTKEKYGYDSVAQRPEVKAKKLQMLMDNHGGIHPSTGKKGMTNSELRKNKMVPPDLVEEYLANGWVFGINDNFSSRKKALHEIGL